LCIVSQPGQVLDRIVNGQLCFIGVNFGRQLDVTVPHQFHRKPLRHAIPLQEGCPSITQRVKVCEAAQFVLISDAKGFRVLLQTPCTRYAVRENQILCRPARRTMPLQCLDNFRHQQNRLLGFIFGRFCADKNFRFVRLQPNIAPGQLPQFFPTQTRPGGGEIDNPTRPRALNQLAQFFIRERPAHPFLLAASVHLENILHGVEFDASAPFHPVQE